MKASRIRVSGLGGLALWVLAATIPLSGCEKAPPNVVLVTVGALRPDSLSCYGAPARSTPNIDRLAAKGVLFRHAFADAPSTTPSLVSSLTGRYAVHHGVNSRFRQIPMEAQTLAEILQSRGYTTAAFVGSLAAASSLGFGRGFDVFDQDFDLPVMPVPPTERGNRVPDNFHPSIDRQRQQQFLKSRADARREDSKVSEAASRWLSARPTKPFFLWIQLFGLQGIPATGLDPQAAQDRTLREYEQDLPRADHAVGHLLDTLEQLGLTGSTLVVLHGDSGRNLGEHGWMQGLDLYDTSLRVPLLMSFPGKLPEGVVVPHLARTVDILPTLTDLAGVTTQGPVDGASLVDLLPGGEPRERELYCETYLPALEFFGREVVLGDGTRRRVGLVRRGVRSREWKLVTTEPANFIDRSESSPIPREVVVAQSSAELYHLLTDPGEKRNLIGKYPEPEAILRQRLKELGAPIAAAPVGLENLGPEQRERVRALGYLE